MNLPHAVLWLDHRNAKVLHFDADTVQVQKVQAHTHDTGQHGSAVRTEHEFFGEVCDELMSVAHIVVTGNHTALSDFRHYVNKHRLSLDPQILGWETVDHPTDPQLLAFARKYFIDRARLAPAGKPG